jgi:menaquinol-cytochrome c reductase cytochrome b/c subunit
MGVTEEFKKKYHERYHQAKQKGVKFWPDVIYKDLLVSFALFIVLILLATFVGVANEPKADPSDSNYIPRPEWYFLFLYEMLKFFPGVLEVVGTFIIPTIAVLTLFLLPLIDRNPNRYFGRRKVAITVMVVIVLAMVGLTIRSVATAHPEEETATAAATLPEMIVAGQDLYSIHCVECHGAEGEGGEIKGVEGLEGFIMKPINSQDEMYTRTDETLFNIISYGQPDLGMPPYGKAFGGELGVGDIDAVVAFMRYTWDDRAELPQEASAAFAAPPLGPEEVPSYEVHISWLSKRYCVSCHRSSSTKENQNNYMETYEEIMTSGDHAPNVIPYDLNSNLYLMVLRQEIEAGGPMPPSQELKPEYVDWWRRWIEAGAPNTAADAAAASGAAAPTGVLTTTVTTPLTTTVTVPVTTTATTPTP